MLGNAYRTLFTAETALLYVHWSTYTYTLDYDPARRCQRNSSLPKSRQPTPRLPLLTTRLLRGRFPV